MAEPPAGPGDDRTLAQSEQSLSGSKELSLPSDVQQNPAAPKIAGYVLVRALGRGAFAEVWKAWQKRTRKWLALKVFTQRRGVNWIFLQREMERLIRLDRHPNVVSLLDADLDAEPPFYAMDLQESGSLDRFPAQGKRASAAEAAKWMEDAAQALVFVHGKGLIHCDIKPANLLLDEEGRLRVADFGQSRIVTESAGALGTLHYMAPEQAMTEDESRDFKPDVQWDVFALGASMFAILSGRVPHGDKRAQIEAATSLRDRLAAYRKLVQSEPLIDLRKVTVPVVDEDLAAIVARCVEADAKKRYKSAADVLHDLRARAEHRPVSPLAGDRVYRLRRYLRRNAAASALGALLAIVLAVSGVSLVRTLGQVRLELANAYILRARAAADKGDDAAAAVFYAKSNEMAPFYQDGLARKSALSHLQAVARPRRVLDLGGQVTTVAASPDGLRAIVGGTGGIRLIELKTGASKDLKAFSGWEPGDIPFYQAAFNRDGSRAFLAIGGYIHLIETDSQKELVKISAARAAFSPDGKTLATTAENAVVMLGDWTSTQETEVYHTKGDVQFWDARTGKATGVTIKVPRKGASDASWVDWSPDGKRLLTALPGSIRLWDPRTGKQAGAEWKYDTEMPFYVTAIDQGQRPEMRATFSPDGSTVLSLTPARAMLFDLAGRQVGKVMRHDGDVRAGVFSRDGDTLMTGGDDGALRMWMARPAKTAKGGEPVGTVLRHGGPVVDIALSPDGKRMATAGADGFARLWSVNPWTPFGAAMPHASPVTAIAFSGDGKLLITGSRDGTVRIWDVPEKPIGRDIVELLPMQNHLSPDASHLVSYDIMAGGELRELPSGKRVGGLLEGAAKANGSGFDAVAFDRSGDRFVTVEHDAKTAMVWDGKTGRFLFAAVSTSTLRAPALSPDGRYLFTYSGDGAIELQEIGQSNGAQPLALKNFVGAAAFSPDGKRIAVSADKDTQIWDVPFGKEAAFHAPHGGGDVTWSPDGTLLATRDLEKPQVRLWSVQRDTVTPIGAPILHEDRLTAMLFSPDSSRFLTASWDGTARLYDARTGALIGTPVRHVAGIGSAAFSPDSSAFATGGADGLIRLWSARTAALLGRALWQGRLIEGLGFAPDGRSLYTIGNWSIQRWDVSWLGESAQPRELLDRAEFLSQKHLDAAGVLEPTPVSEWIPKLNPS